ncbi:MAG: hypothetical protein GY899_09010 [Verrucomicrobiaceae bacterium]|nr:hypothetical protein [Verrucomicrobiaceae bacterium]
MRSHAQSGGVALTHFSPENSDYELLLYAVGGTGHRLGRKHMTKAIDYMGEFFLRHPKKRAAEKPNTQVHRK